jgi:D-serine deaminase-like pyridoxal phosphate-dependent protein
MDDYGLILEYPNARIYGLSEEHGNVDLTECARKPEVGERIRVIPNHCCVVSNLFDHVSGVRDGLVETTWLVAARGRSQ